MYTLVSLQAKIYLSQEKEILIAQIFLKSSVFDSSTDIPWPEGEEALSVAAVQAVDNLLSYDPTSRSDFESVKLSDLFSCINWADLKDIEAPFIPQPDDATDTTYFEGKLFQLLSSKSHHLFCNQTFTAPITKKGCHRVPSSGIH